MRTLACLLASAALWIAARAHADIADSDGFPGCTVALVQQRDETCETCQASYTDHDLCARNEGLRGYTQRCVGPGRLEVWCMPTPTLPPLPPPPPPPRAARVERPCDCATPGTPASGVAGLASLALALLAGLALRRPR